MFSMQPTGESLPRRGMTDGTGKRDFFFFSFQLPFPMLFFTDDSEITVLAMVFIVSVFFVPGPRGTNERRWAAATDEEGGREISEDRSAIRHRLSLGPRSESARRWRRRRRRRRKAAIAGETPWHERPTMHTWACHHGPIETAALICVDYFCSLSGRRRCKKNTLQKKHARTRCTEP